MAKMRNCVFDKEEFIAEVWGAMVMKDSTKKIPRRGAVVAAYEEAVALGEKERMLAAEAKLKEAQMELAAAEASKKSVSMNELTMRAAEVSAMKAQTEAMKLMATDKTKKVGQ